MLFKKKREQVMNAWGELCDEAPERRPAGKLAIERADALPEKQRRRRYALMAGAALALAAVARAGGTCAAMSSTASAPGAADAAESQPSSGQASGQEPQSDVSRYANISKWEFLSDESKADFASRFDAYAEELGLGDGPAMCYSRIEADAGVYTAWLSLPVGERFFKVTFVARDKSFAFEECAMPEGLPEVNYSSVEAQADSQTESRAETPADEEQAYPSQADSSYMSVDRGQRDAAAAEQHSWVRCDSASSLSGFLGSAAASQLPGSVTGWLASKGYAAEASACQIDLASVSGTSALIGFSMKCATSSGEVSLDCEWNDAAGQFGFALA